MKNVKELRTFLGDIMKGLKDGTIDVEKAKTISELGQVIVNSAKVEVDFLKAAKIKDATDFISDGIVRSLSEKSEKSGKREDDADGKFTRHKAEYDNESHDQRLKKYGN